MNKQNQNSVGAIQLNFLKYKTLCAMLVFVCLAVCLGIPASAAGEPAKITSCRLTSSDKVEIKTEAVNTNLIYGADCYLFVKSLSDTSLTKSDKPVAVTAKAPSMTFRVDLNFTTSASVLYSRFVLGEKTAEGTYRVISNEAYITNPDQLAKNRYKFPTAVTKKGLQVANNLYEDMAELNVRHSIVNIVLTNLIPIKGHQNSAYAIPFSYHGKTYWFSKTEVSSIDKQMQAYGKNDVIVSAILLLGYRDDQTSLIYPGARTKGKLFYAWNTKTVSERETFQAMLTFLAERYSGANGSKGRIVNWIVGNEVNNRSYHYTGTSNLEQHCRIYADAFRLTYNTVRSIYADARVYISLDHIWNRDDVPATFAARKVLDTFAAILKSQGNISWNLAYHPYGSPLTEPRFWANVNGQVKQSLDSPVINMGNLSLLTNYIKQTYGSGTRIILSEQGFNSVQNTASGKKQVEKEQAAAVAYSYFIAESDDMVDSFIMMRQIDHPYEVKQGISQGLWTTAKTKNTPEWAKSKKLAWNVFKYMDTSMSESVTSGLLSVIGIKNWKEVIKNYGEALFSKVSVTKGTITKVNKYQKTGTIPSKWSAYGAVANSSAKKGTFHAAHNNARNRNALWGYEQKFSKAVDFGSNKTFYTTLKLKGSNNKKALLKICFYSGAKVLECQDVIQAGKTLRIGVSLAKWKYRSAVTKISVLLAPYGSGKWKANAALDMMTPVQGA